MTEQQDVIDALQAASVLDAVRWAFDSACNQTIADYAPLHGHDTQWVGNTRYKVLQNRLDRVFAQREFAPPAGSGQEVSRDLLYAGLPQAEIDTMPLLPVGTAYRDDFNQSPGWTSLGYRILIASFTAGRIDEIQWTQKSTTKKRVAQQPNPDPAQEMLFEETDLDPETFALLMREDLKLDRETFVLAHALDADSNARELYLGRPALNVGGGAAWHWRHALVTPVRGDDGGLGAESGPTEPLRPGPDATSVEDANVKLRKAAGASPKEAV